MSKLIGIPLNLQIALGSVAILTILILPIQGHGISFHFFDSSSVYFVNVLQFSVYKSFTSLVRFIPKHFILGSVIFIRQCQRRFFCLFVLFCFKFRMISSLWLLYVAFLGGMGCVGVKLHVCSKFNGHYSGTRWFWRDSWPEQLSISTTERGEGKRFTEKAEERRDSPDIWVLTIQMENRLVTMKPTEKRQRDKAEYFSQTKIRYQSQKRWESNMKTY